MYKCYVSGKHITPIQVFGLDESEPTGSGAVMGCRVANWTRGKQEEWTDRLTVA